MTDAELLCEYCRRRSEPAFAELVQRHAGWVYAAALRQVRDSHLAEDVTQAVFIALAKKAPRLRRGAAVSGWLFRAMRYAAGHAMRAESRRRRHERRAAAMVSESSVAPAEPQWEVLAPHLEELVGRLRARDHQTILLRFYQQKMFAEVGQAMGISEQAARKRTDRAVRRLREMFARRGISVGTSANLAVVMTEQLLHPPAAALVSATTKAALGAAAGNAATLAEAALRMINWAWVKTVAAIVAVGLAMAGTAIVGGRAANSPALAPVPIAAALPATGPTTQPEPENPQTNVPGVAQIAQWDVILNQTGAESIGDLGYPLRTASKIYHASICGGEELRRAVYNAMATGGFENGSLSMKVGAEDPTSTDHALQLVHDVGFLPSYEWGRPGRNVAINGSDDGRDIIHRVSPQTLHLQLSHSQMQLNLGELNRQRNTSTWGNLSGESIVYDGKLSSGEALAFLGRFEGPSSGKAYYHLVVWEAFNATEAQMKIISRQADSAEWCQLGPGQMRQWADVASAWSARVPASAVSPPAFIRHLESGLVVELSAISRPARWPYCWWNGDGAPVADFEGMMLDWQSGDGPRELAATGEVKLVVQESGPPAEWGRQFPDPKISNLPPNIGNDFSGVWACSISDTQRTLEVGVPVGPWVELGQLQFGQSLRIGEVKYSIDDGTTVNDDVFLVRLTWSSDRRDQLCLVAVVADGKEVSPWGPTVIFGGVDPIGGSPNFRGIRRSQVKYFRLWRRQRQWVTFSNFVVDPNPSPSTITDTPAKTSSGRQTSPASSP